MQEDDIDLCHLSRLARLILTFPDQDRESWIIYMGQFEEHFEKGIRAEMAAQLEQRAKGAERT